MAAQQGDTEAMRELIDDYDRLNPLQCWTWFYLAKLLGTDLSKNEYRLMNEDGSAYDDDVGGPAEVIGRDGVEPEPIDENRNSAAQRAAATLYQAKLSRLTDQSPHILRQLSPTFTALRCCGCHCAPLSPEDRAPGSVDR